MIARFKRWVVRRWRITFVPEGATLYLPDPEKTFAYANRIDFIYGEDSTVIFGPPPELSPLPWIGTIPAEESDEEFARQIAEMDFKVPQDKPDSASGLSSDDQDWNPNRIW